MGNSYVRQSAADIQTGNIVEADPINAEFNALQSAFDASAGHSHDGTVGEGQKISLTSSIVGVLPVANGGYGGIHNTTATTDPGVSNDSSQGYSVGSVWINTTAKSYFVCTDNTLGAAVWSSFQLVDSALGSIAGLTTTANQTIYTTGSDTYATTSLTAYGRSLIDDADAATARGTLGLGTIATQNSNSVTITGGAITGTPISGSTVAGTTGTFSGNVSGVAGTFSGAVSGTTGTFSGTITTGGNAVWHAGNLTPANYAPLAGATFTGGISGTTASFSGSVTASGQAVWHAGNLTPSNYTPLAGGTMTGLLTLSGDPTARLHAVPKQYSDGARNQDDLIINGCFDVAQRGTSQTVNGYGSLDRWVAGVSGGSFVQSREAFTTGDTIGSNVKPYFCRMTTSGQSLASHYAIRQQRIQDVRSYSGQTITILGWARRSSGAGNMALEFTQDFGTGGSPSSVVVGIGSQQISLSSLWVPFAATVTIPSIAGKTIGTDGNHSLNLILWTSAGSDFNARTATLGLQTIDVDLFGIHIRKGVVPVEAANYYSPPPFLETERNCQYYYRTILVNLMSGATAATYVVETHVLWPAMRTTPTITQTAAGASNLISSATFSAYTNYGGRFQIISSAGGDMYVLDRRYSLDAEL